METRVPSIQLRGGSGARIGTRVGWANPANDRATPGDSATIHQNDWSDIAGRLLVQFPLAIMQELLRIVQLPFGRLLYGGGIQIGYPGLLW